MGGPEIVKFGVSQNESGDGADPRGEIPQERLGPETRRNVNEK